MRFITIFVLAYVPGFLAVATLHLTGLPMVTFGLAMLRAATLDRLWLAARHAATDGLGIFRC